MKVTVPFVLFDHMLFENKSKEEEERKKKDFNINIIDGKTEYRL